MNRILKFEMFGCAPCTYMNQVIKQLTMNGELNKGIHSIDIRSLENKALVKKHNVRSVPLMIEVDENDNELRRLTDRSTQGIKDFINHE